MTLAPLELTDSRAASQGLSLIRDPTPCVLSAPRAPLSRGKVGEISREGRASSVSFGGGFALCFRLPKGEWYISVCGLQSNVPPKTVRLG